MLLCAYKYLHIFHITKDETVSHGSSYTVHADTVNGFVSVAGRQENCQSGIRLV